MKRNRFLKSLLCTIIIVALYCSQLSALSPKETVASLNDIEPVEIVFSIEDLENGKLEIPIYTVETSNGMAKKTIYGNVGSCEFDFWGSNSYNLYFSYEVISSYSLDGVVTVQVHEYDDYGNKGTRRVNTVESHSGKRFSRTYGSFSLPKYKMYVATITGKGTTSNGKDWMLSGKVPKYV